jgi:hypothetical protein
MKPSEIHSLLKQAKAAYKDSSAGIHTFALYWITWEAYRTRMLAVAARLRGWRIEDAYLAIGTKKISTQKSYKWCFKAVTTVQLAEQSGIVASVLSHLDSIEIIRHRLIHGYRSTSPDLIHSANQFIDSILTHQEKVFSALIIPLKDGKQIQIGNVLSQRPASGRGIPIDKNYESIKECFGLKETDMPRTSPNRSIIQALEKIVTKLSE